jgi:uncharacterized delta-60 repeat protein
MLRLIALVLLTLPFCHKIQAQARFLDSLFASSGQTRFGVSKNLINAQKILVQPDGFMVSSFIRRDTASKLSYLGMVRHNPSGTVDPVFGNASAGVYDLRESATNDQLLGTKYVLRLRNGKYIVVNQRSADSSYLHGVNAEGKPDLSFGSNGMMKYPVYIFDEIVETASGNIRALCGRKGGLNSIQLGFIEILPDGAPNPQFNAGKVLWLPDVENYTEYSAAQALPDDGFVAAGRIEKNQPNNNFDLTIAKYNRFGQADFSFGSDGVFILNLSPFQERYYDLEVLPNGKILAAGSSNNSLIVTQHRANGQLDSMAFGINGILSIKKVSDFNVYEVNDLLALGNDGFYAMGYAEKGTEPHGFVGKFKANGQPDSSWGEHGFVFLGMKELGFKPNFKQITLQNDGKILVLSSIFAPNNHQMAILKIAGSIFPQLWYEDADGDGFGNPGKSISAISKPTGYVINGRDCLDNNPQVNPNALEICGNQLDDNCNGTTDEDLTSPIARCKSDVNAVLNEQGEVLIKAKDLDLGSSDNCGPVILLASDLNLDCDDVGKTIQISLLVADQSNNVSACNSRIKVLDLEKPVMSCKEGPFIYLDNFGKAEIEPEYVDGGSSDNCGIAKLSLSKTQFTCDDINNQQLTLTAFDRAGNSSTCLAIVSVKDTIDPIAICVDTFPITLKKPTDTISVPAEVIDIGSYDNCRVTDLQIDKKIITVADIGLVPITLTVTDWQKNKNTCVTIVKVETKGFSPVQETYHWPVRISPNPSSGIFELKWPEQAPAPDVIRVYDMLGKVVWETNTNPGNTTTIDIGQQAAGTYLLQLRSGSYVHTEMLVVVK